MQYRRGLRLLEHKSAAQEASLGFETCVGRLNVAIAFDRGTVLVEVILCL